MVDCLLYFAVFAIVFLVNYLAMKQNNILTRKLLIGLSFLTLLLFIGFRYNVGTDYNNYLRAYGRISNMAWEKLPALKIELLVATIFKICSFVLWDAKLVFLVMGFLLLYPIYKTNKLYDYKYLAYSVLLFCIMFLPFGLNGMRQGIAMGFILLSMVRLLRNNMKLSIFDFVLATLFHTSSLVVLPYMIMLCMCRRWGWSYTLSNTILTGAVSIIVLFFLNSILIDNGITQYNYMLGNIDTERITLDSIIVYLPIVAIILLLDKRKAKNSETIVYENMFLSGIFFFIIGTAAQYLSRFGLFFMMPSIILVPRILQDIPKRNSRLIIKGLFVAYLILFFYVQYSLFGKQEIIPYQTWIFGGII